GATATRLATTARIALKQGWFSDTLPQFRPAAPIAVLRMDGDWYDSTLCILEHLWPQLAPEALVIVDDYYDWDGCARAVHDFLSREGRSERIQQSWTGGIAHLVVRPPAA